MKRSLVIPLVLLFSVLTHADDEKGKSELRWRKFDEGLAEAKKSKKKIMIDVYADWCKWCKKLDTEVYTESNVLKYLNEAYIPVKVDGESDAKLTYKGKTYTEAQLARAFGVTGFPTIIFLDSQGEPIDKLGGFVDAERFLPIIKFIGDDAYKSMSWEDYTKKNQPKKKKM